MDLYSHVFSVYSLAGTGAIASMGDVYVSYDWGLRVSPWSYGYLGKMGNCFLFSRVYVVENQEFKDS
jgi:hypothetical protein